jgi:putative hydrolase of the HAD superfamily
MVVSTAPEPGDWRALEEVTGMDLAPVSSPYWANRKAFDGGKLTPREYWGGVLGRPVGAAEVELLESLDSAQWSHLNAQTLSVLQALRDEQASVALLSNMPDQMSQRHLTGSSWTRFFSKLYFSGPLGLVKPDRQIFDHVVADLGVRPGDVVFIDDNAANIATAQKLGFITVLHTSATDLREELSKLDAR